MRPARAIYIMLDQATSTDKIADVNIMPSSGVIRFEHSPANPAGVEGVSSVLYASPPEIVDWFYTHNRLDLAEIYLLASRILHQ